MVLGFYLYWPRRSFVHASWERSHTESDIVNEVNKDSKKAIPSSIIQKKVNGVAIFMSQKVWKVLIRARTIRIDITMCLMVDIRGI